MAIGILDQPIEVEERGGLHRRVSSRAQELDTASEGEVLPQMLREPGGAHRPARPNGVALSERAHLPGVPPEIAVVVRHPSAAAVVDARRLSTIFGELFDE